jgi:hypothetical protein
MHGRRGWYRYFTFYMMFFEQVKINNYMELNPNLKKSRFYYSASYCKYCNILIQYQCTLFLYTLHFLCT